MTKRLFALISMQGKTPEQGGKEIMEAFQNYQKVKQKVEQNMGIPTIKPRKTLMGWNYFWFLPICLFMLLKIELPNIISGYHNIVLALKHFTLGYLISPSAYVFFVAIFSSVTVPIVLLITVPHIFSGNDMELYKRKYLYSVIALLAIFIGSLILQFIIWGSLPFGIDNQGYVHLRLIPFIPWPTT